MGRDRIGSKYETSNVSKHWSNDRVCRKKNMLHRFNGRPCAGDPENYHNIISKSQELNV